MYGSSAVIAVLTVVAVIVLFGGSRGTKPSTAGVPYSGEYHALLVDHGDPSQLTLGTHDGLYVSSDGGRSWRFAHLPGKDAMNLAQSAPDQLWVAGHNLLKKSSTGGQSWSDVQASGLPDLDIHGFAVDPRDPRAIYAAVANEGLFRSVDGGLTFSRVSRVGADVTGLAITGDRIYAADPERGLLTSSDGGSRWKDILNWQVFGIATDPRDPRRLIAAGAGIAVSTNGGRTWRSALDLPGGAGPVAWSSDGGTAYVLGFDGTLFRSLDKGESWHVVSRPRSPKSG